ncbi:MAG: type I restriction enzyme HsdR N-terminal domain-containing protein [bacterium]|nr:type I restriction enzyme HsdR N-terminal domain-containing protein [bacterium]
MIQEKITKEQRKAIRDSRKIIEQVFEADGNEAETRKRVERIFEWVMGYDVFKHITRERAIQAAGEAEYVDFAIQLEPGMDAQPIIFVELKRVGIKLSRKHLKQVTSYAIDAGCEWVLLTNGREWKLYHIEFGKPPVAELLDSWNLLEDKVDILVRKFEVINLKSIKKDGLNKQWERVKVLHPDTLLAALIDEDSFKIIRRTLRKRTGILVDYEEIYNGIFKLLNEKAGIVMSDIKTPTATKPKRQPKTDKG